MKKDSPVDSPYLSLPQNAEAEKGVICGMLLDPGIIDDIAARCTQEHFHNPANGTLFAGIVSLHHAGKPLDFIVLTNALRDSGMLDEIGGSAYVTEVSAFVATAAHTEHYLEIVQEKYLLRQIILACREFERRAFTGGESVVALLDELQGRVTGIAQEGQSNETLRPISESVIDAADQIEQTYKHRGSVVGVGTGLVQLDRMTGGLRGGQMIVIGARPAMGKTALAMNIAEHVAMFREEHKERAPLPVAVFTLEMGRTELTTRILCNQANVNLQRVRDGFLSAAGMAQISAAANRIADAPIYLDDTPALSILQWKARVRRAVARFKVRLVVIDYVQLMRSTSKRAQENRVLELTEISNGIKSTARELDVPVIVLAQLNREVEKRTGSRPQLADLRECGAIEQDADVVALLYRAEYYAKNDEQRQELEGKAELIIAKQRNGPVGSVHLTFIKEYTRFENQAGERLYSNDPEHRQQ